ncbi:hypothetical protein E4U34_005887 [Claviceps purpurea]|nr:hypothetical protein E4U34_005887 [Claviceps purpurea]
MNQTQQPDKTKKNDTKKALKKNTKTNTKKSIKNESPKSDKKGESSKNGKNSAVVELHCAMYRPQSSKRNFYHWAFAIKQAVKSGKHRWQIFQVAQEKPDSPYKRNMRQVDPTSSTTCLKPLTLLGQMTADYWDWLIEAVEEIPVPGEADSWNCQDYVLEIWELLLDEGAINKDTWTEGYDPMLTCYGQDFGGGQDTYGTDESEEDEAVDENDGERRVLSEEFVYDSDSC